MPSHSTHRVQDSVHGLMEFRGMEATVIELLSTRELRRLRNVKQLGLANLVFPAAEHSRMVHALGSAHLTLRFARQLEDVTAGVLDEALRPNEEVRRDLAVAALCHDIGHGPLSHAWDTIMRGYQPSPWFKSLGVDDKFGPEDRPDWHELVAQGLLCWEDGELHQALESMESGLSERIARLLRGDYYLPYLARILDSDVDADRCDYLIRDAMMTGVAYGRYDIDWLISTATVGEHEDRGLVFGFEGRKALRVIEQVIVARRALYQTVYQHKAVRSAELMLANIFRRLRETVPAHSEAFGGHEAFEIFAPFLSDEPATCGALVQLTDDAMNRLIALLARESPDEVARDLASRLQRRELFKLVEVPDDFPPVDLISDLVEKAGFDEPKSYWAVEQRATIPDLSTTERKRPYLVDSRDSGALGVARVLEKLHIMPPATSGNQTFRIWCVEEAVSGVRAGLNLDQS